MPVRMQAGGRTETGAEEEFELSLEVVKQRKNRTQLSRARRHMRLFGSCNARRKYSDVSLCGVEALLTASIALLLLLELWQCLALGPEYFKELENWFELLILVLALTTLSLKQEMDTLQIVSSVAICLAWLELIFLFGRYPFLGGSFSIMYYSITKRIVKTALGFLILICAFTFAFFIIHFGNETESFDNVGRSFLKIFVMVLGEFEFDDLWSDSASSSSRLSQIFTMILLIALIIFGSMIMVNLIVAIIISDIEWLNKISELQALLNQAHHAVQFQALVSLFLRCSRRVAARSSGPATALPLCVHSVCGCGLQRAGPGLRHNLLDILQQRQTGTRPSQT